MQPAAVGLRQAIYVCFITTESVLRPRRVTVIHVSCVYRGQINILDSRRQRKIEES